MFTCGPAFMASGTVYGPTDNQYYVEVTVPSGKVASDLTNFPVMIDMANLPAAFWSHVSSSGSEIRVKSAGGASSLAFDVARFDKANSAGWLFVKVPTLAAASSNVIRIYYGATSLAALAKTDTYGRNAVWADYHMMTVFSEPGTDRTGNNHGAYPWNMPEDRHTAATLFSPGFTTSTNHDQGIFWDGTYWYLTTSQDIYKYNSSWTLVASNVGAYANVSGANHIGACTVVGGYLYAPIENYNSTLNTSTLEHVARFNLSDLSFDTAYDSAASLPAGTKLSGLAYNPDDGYIWACDYVNGTPSLLRLTTSGVYVDSISLSYSNVIDLLQGLCFSGGKIYASSNSSARVWEIGQDGTVRKMLREAAGSSAEGLCIGPNGKLVQLVNDVVVELTPGTRPAYGAEGWLNIDGGNNASAFANGVTKFTSWSMGCSALLNVKASNRAIMTYAQANNSVDANRETLAYRSATDTFGVWNTTDTWTNGGSSPATGTVYRLNVTHDGTTARTLYINGSGTIDNAVAQRPAGTGDGLFFGRPNSATTEMMQGRLNFVYLRNGVLSADWIAGESGNWGTPSSFYTVGSEQPA